MSVETKTVQEFCCWYFKTARLSKQIKTKDEAFPDHKKWNDQKLFKMHAQYLIYNDDEDVQKAAWHWFHYCPNCGHKYSTDEQIQYWEDYWINSKITINK